MIGDAKLNYKILKRVMYVCIPHFKNIHNTDMYSELFVDSGCAHMRHDKKILNALYCNLECINNIYPNQVCFYFCGYEFANSFTLI